MMFFLGKGVAICYVASDIVEWKNCYKYQEDKRCLTVIYQAWDAVFFITRWNTEKRVENTTRNGVFFDELRCVLSGDETLCRMLDITSQTKWF